LNDLSKPFYFATVPLYAHWGYDDPEDAEPNMNTQASMRTPNDVNYNAGIFKNILENEELRNLVNKVDVYTCNPDCVS
jgi:hypothetical protein